MIRLARTALPNALLYLISRLRQHPRGSVYKRVGIYKVDRLGDFVLALGAIRLLVQHYGVKHCVLFGSRYSAELAAVEFPGLEIVELSTGHNSLWRTRVELYRMRRHPAFQAGVETLICLRHHRTLHDDVVLGAIPAKQTWGNTNSPLTDAAEQISRSRLSFDNSVIPLAPAANECKELAWHRSLVSRVLGRQLSAADTLPEFADASVTSQEYAGISPFSSSAVKDIAPAQLIKICEELVNRGLEIRLWADPRQRPRFNALALQLGQKLRSPIKIVVTETIRDLIHEVRGARLIISADTVTAHIATAMNKPLVALLGGGHFGWFAPWRRSQNQQWVTNRMDCFGCNWQCMHPEPYCLTRIDAAEISRAMENSMLSVASNS